jgi:single-stranded DNA-specific DHH superfamily exonuclease
VLRPYGDFDLDDITSTAILTETIRDLGGPDRRITL